LYGKPMELMKLNSTSPIATFITTVTDNNNQTSQALSTSSNTGTSYGFAYTFSTPKNITAYELNIGTTDYGNFVFLDSSGATVGYIPVVSKSSKFILSSPISNVSRVIVQMQGGVGSALNFIDFDFFGTDQLPTNPSNLAATVGNGYVDLAWAASQYGSSYKVKKSNNPGGPYTTISSDSNSTSFRDTNVVNGKTYYYVVSAANTGGESGNSNEVSSTLQPDVPSVPTIFSTQSGDAQVGLVWGTVTGATSYNLKRSTTSGGPYSTISSNLAAQSYTDTNVTNGTTYYYVATAVNAAGESGNSNEVNAKPQAPLPGSPANLVATSGDSQVGLSWDTVTNATYYYVKRSTSLNGTYVTIKNDAVTPAFDTVTNGTTYYYYVTAIISGTESAISNKVSVTPLPNASIAPTNLIATPGNTQVNLAWDTVTNAALYNVKRSTTAGGPYTSIATVASATYTDNNVANGTAYYYVVTALNIRGESTISNESSATPQFVVSQNKIALTITLTSGLERKYDLSLSEFDAFTNWYDTKASGTGPARYTFKNPISNVQYVNRNNSIIFDKILTFDYDEYVPTN
jgi:fibronectin type 3 domain-containing protein